MYSVKRMFKSDIHIFEFNPKIQRSNVEFETWGKLEPLSVIEEPQEDERAVCKVNAGFFALDGSKESIGVVVRDGKYYGSLDNVYYAILDKQNNLKIASVKELSYVAYLQGNSKWVAPGSFPVVLNGEINTEFMKNFPSGIWKYKHPRTAIGQKSNGNILLVVIRGRDMNNAGTTGYELAEIMKNLNCKNALNLDGGGSSEMIVDDKIVSPSSDGSERLIGTAIVVYDQKEVRSKMKKIFIDPGHGGSDPGAVANGMNEKDINLIVALKLKELLEDKGFDIKLSRETDKYVSLYQRAYMANEWGADYFVSIHHNAGGGDGWEIIHTIHTDISEGDELAEAIGKEFTALGQDMRRIFARESTKYPGTDYYTVIGQSNMPAIITEFAFMDSEDVKIIDTEDELNKEAMAIYEGICNYLGVEVDTWEEKYYQMVEQLKQAKQALNSLKQDIKNLTNKY